MLSGFSNEKIVSILGVHSLWGKRVCREVLNRKNDFIPLLIGVLDEAGNAPWLFINKENQAHVPSALLLAQMRAAQAYPQLVSLITFNKSTASGLWGNLLAGQYPWILRDTFNGEAFLLPNLIEDRSVSPLSRAAAVKAWGMHYFDGYLSREEITGCFRCLLQDVYSGTLTEDDKTVLTQIAHCIREHHLEELIDDVQSVYARDGINESLCGDPGNYKSEFNNPQYRAQNTHIDDAIRALEELDWFKERQAPHEASAQVLKTSTEDQQAPPPPKKSFANVGRNEPCPCGAGRKFKHCCLVK